MGERGKQIRVSYKFVMYISKKYKWENCILIS